MRYVKPACSVFCQVGMGPGPRASVPLNVVVIYVPGDGDHASERETVTREDSAAFRGDVLIVESEHDAMVPHQVIRNYMDACGGARSMIYGMVTGAAHGLSDPAWRQAYTSLLVGWVGEMVLGARAGTRGPG